MHNENTYYKDTVNSIKDPRARKWAEIARQMATHIDGECPIYIYKERRPLESKNPYALDYRIQNFKPVTQQEFDKSIGGIQRMLSTANVIIDKDDRIEDILLQERNVKDYILHDLVREREKDPNAIIVLIPEIRVVNDTTVVPIGWEAVMVQSKNIVEIEDSHVVVFVGKEKEKYNISKEGIDIIKKDKSGKEYAINILQYDIDVMPYIYISNLVTYCSKTDVIYRRGYYSGAAAWGDKFYAQETDFIISATNNTYLHQVRYKPLCTQVGSVMINGIHCDADTKEPCHKCGGSGYTIGSSPLHIIDVPYNPNDAEQKPLEDMVKYAEPPQNAIKTSKEIVDSYYDAMCASLGLVSQNMTNQSGVSKSFDYQQKIDMIYAILDDSKRIIKEIYSLLTEIYRVKGEYKEVSVSHIGELRMHTEQGIYEQYKRAKESNAMPYVQEQAIDAILLHTLGDSDTTRTIIRWAKVLDKLYVYGSDIVAIKGQLGNSVTTTDIYRHNSIIRDLVEYFSSNGLDTDPTQYISTLYPSVAQQPLLI